MTGFKLHVGVLSSTVGLKMANRDTGRCDCGRRLMAVELEECYTCSSPVLVQRPSNYSPVIERKYEHGVLVEVTVHE